MEFRINHQPEDTICAISTAPGRGGIAVIRVSGSEAIAVTDRIFHPVKQGKNIAGQAANTVCFGTIRDEQGNIVDEAVVTLFRAPHSFTGEDTTEISCHGSLYIQQQIITLLLRNGARMAPVSYTHLRAHET